MKGKTHQTGGATKQKLRVKQVVEHPTNTWLVGASPLTFTNLVTPLSQSVSESQEWPRVTALALKCVTIPTLSQHFCSLTNLCYKS